MRRLSMFTGLAMALAGMFLIFMLYAFGTMLAPDIQGVAREAALWRRVLSEPTFPFGIIVTIIGGRLMFRDGKREVAETPPDPKPPT